jgi:hypothetical protein
MRRQYTALAENIGENITLNHPPNQRKQCCFQVLFAPHTLKQPQKYINSVNSPFRRMEGEIPLQSGAIFQRI